MNWQMRERVVCTRAHLSVRSSGGEVGLDTEGSVLLKTRESVYVDCQE